MSQVLSIRFSKKPIPQAEVFLDEWQCIGTWSSAADNTYELRSQSGDNLLFTCSEAEFEITGYTKDDTFSFIEGFAKRHSGELLHEGEPLSQDQDFSKWKTLNPFAKAAGIIVIIILFPIIIIALPILLLVLFARLALHFFRQSRSSLTKP